MNEPSAIRLPHEDAPLSKVVRESLERSCEIHKLRAMIQSKVLEIVRSGATTPFTQPPDNDADSPRDIINNLIMEYLHWSGLIYSADMFASECGMAHQPPSRINLENFLGEHEKDSPILMSIVGGIMNPTEN